MGRRAAKHDYSRPGIYHITIRVADSLGHPLGAVVGTDADCAAVTLTRAGEAIQHELLTAISAHYPMITVDEYVVMPEHQHFILNVSDPIVTKDGNPTHLGQIIAGFKKGSNRAYWAATGQTSPAGGGAESGAPAAAHGGAPAAKPLEAPATKPQGALSAAKAAAPAATKAGAATAPANTAPGGSAAGNARSTAGKARYSTGRPPLFAPGYCDVMPIEPGQLETQRAYIRNNPRSRWLRSHDRQRLQPQRGGIDTAVTPAALRRYLQQVCPPWQATPEALAAIERRLLLADGTTPAGKTAGNTERSGNAGRPAPTIACDSYGDRALLQRPLLPVVCHRKDEARRAEQKARCLEAAAQGAVLVSPRIAPGEQAIIDEAANRGFATILIVDNGFPEVFHPSTERIAACADGRLLLVTPWQYQFRPKDEQITVPFCKTMNCVAQALCRKKDDWWKTTAPGGSAATASGGSATTASGGSAVTASGGFPARTTPEQKESRK